MAVGRWQKSVSAFTLQFGSCVRQQLKLLGMASGNHRPVAPLDPAAHTGVFAASPFEVDARGGKCRYVPALDADGEVAPPIIGEIEIDATAALSRLGDLALDKLKALRKTAEPLNIVGALDAVGRRAPYTEMLGPRLSLACEKLCDAGAVVGKGIDAGKTLGDKLLLQPDGLVIAHDEHLTAGDRSGRCGG